ncbi:hypothetical protein P3S67_022396 [Capsicum chacoense]
METLMPYWSFIINLNKFPLFNLEKAVCNHGFFMMAPNDWDPSTKGFSRPLRLADSITSAMTTISQPPRKDHLVVKVYGSSVLFLEDERAIQSQVMRMLRLSVKDEQDVGHFHKLHPDAEAKGFGRLFRSPTLFEDVAKSLLLRFCPWKTSLDLAKALCDLQRKKFMSKRKIGDFPSPQELASFREEELKRKANFGFRAKDLIMLAKQVVDRKIDLSKFEKYDADARTFNVNINGAGPFTTHTIMMCAGYYGNIPIDSETVRHMKEFHGLNIKKRKKESLSPKIQQFYKHYHPFESLAYWFELSNSYEIKLGKALSKLLQSEYQYATGNYEKNKNEEEEGEEELLNVTL